MKRKLSEKELNIIIKGLRNADYVLLDSSKGTSFFGTPLELLAAYAGLTNKLLEKVEIPKEYILEACKLGLDMENMYEKKAAKKSNKEIDKEIDKKLETIEKLMGILKDLRKGDR